MRSISAALLLLAISAPSASGQQRPEAGPIVNSGGPVFIVEDPTFETPTDRELKAIFELRTAPDDLSRPQQQVGTMARYLNMHAKNGVPRENVRVAGVVHGSAVWAVLTDENHRERHGMDNPNRAMIEEIIASGGQVILCGQSAAARQIAREDLLPGVQVAMSAMTALTVLQQDGYQIILW